MGHKESVIVLRATSYVFDLDVYAGNETKSRAKKVSTKAGKKAKKNSNTDNQQNFIIPELS